MFISSQVLPKISAVPEKPVGPIKFKDIDATSLTLEWQPPKDDGGSKISGYKVQVTTDQNIWTDVTIAQKTTCSAKQLVTDQSYYFRVIAFNDIGESKPLDSDEVICRKPKSMKISL